MSAQTHYKRGNEALELAEELFGSAKITASATLACAYYLRAICEMLGTKFSEDQPTTKGE